MIQHAKSRSIVYPILGSILAFLALNAFGGGYYGMAGAKDVPLTWLDGSPFKDYLIPSIFLFAVIGGLALISSILAFRKSHSARKAALLTGVIVLIWILIQLILIGYVSWMQPFTVVMAMCILILAMILPVMSQSRIESL